MNLQPAPFAADFFADHRSPSLRYAREKEVGGFTTDNEYRRSMTGNLKHAKKTLSK